LANQPDENRGDLRSPQAKAYQWASKITTISLEMVVPGVLGYFVLDRYLGTKFVFCLLGFAAGMSFGIWHLVQFTSSEELNSDN